MNHADKKLNLLIRKGSSEEILDLFFVQFLMKETCQKNEV